AFDCNIKQWAGEKRPKPAEESYEYEEDEHVGTQCGSCGGNFNIDEL
nr:hypothetical protein [Tanacetum cinerariifolium]